MDKVKRILKLAAVIIVLVAIAAGSVAMFANYSDGSRMGTVIKFSRKGVVFKTYEGQLNLGGISKDASGGLTPSIWEFSVQRGEDEVQQAIEDALSHGHRVKLHYKEKFYQFDWRGKTKYFVYEVEKVEE